MAIDEEQLKERVNQAQQDQLSAGVKLTHSPVSRLTLESLKFTPHSTDQTRLINLQLTFNLTVEPSDCNSFGSIHGGCVFSICNVAGKIALNTMIPQATQLVSTDLTTNYLAGVESGSTVQVEAECMRTTKSIGFMRGCIRNKGNLCYVWVQNIGFVL